MCGVVIMMDGNGGDKQQQRDGSAMGDCNGAGTIAISNCGSGAMNDGMTEQL